MFREREWTLTGESGREYPFVIVPKSEPLPQAPGVFMLAYVHPRGHMSGWQVNPLIVDHAEDMRLAIETEAQLGPDETALWNCNFIYLQDDTSVREACVRDLAGNGTKRVLTVKT